MDFKSYFFLLIIIILGVYLGSMWTHKMIKQQEQAEADRLFRLQQQAGGTPQTA